MENVNQLLSAISCLNDVLTDSRHSVSGDDCGAGEKMKKLIALIPETLNQSPSPSDALVGIQKNKLSESDLISFGNYLLSKERAERIVQHEKAEEFSGVVSQSDIDGWINSDNK